MKCLILGGHGMAGHVMVSYFKQKSGCQVIYTSRDSQDQDSILLDAADMDQVKKLVSQLKPDVMINCIGILNQQAAENPKEAILANSLLPHVLAEEADKYNGKLIHISTDCVFEGTKGDYTEDDPADGTSSYAQSKRLGEVVSDRHLTIRTSIIGPEMKENGIGLFLWFMKQTGRIKGYERVFWNGVTTLELAKAAESLLEQNVSGLLHLGSQQKISKHKLLLLIQEIFEKDDVEIVPDGKFVQDRTIRSIRNDFIYEVPSYRTMLVEMKEWMKAE